MRHWKHSLALSAILLLMRAGAATGSEPSHSAAEIIKRVDDLFRSRTSRATVEMRIKNPHWERTMRFEMWSEGLNKTRIVIQAPKKDAGTGTLRLGSEMWNYFPNAGKVMKVPPSMMMASWMGSDFTNDDLVKENTYEQDYLSTLDKSPTDQGDEYTVVSKAKPGAATVWAKVVTRVRKSDLIPTIQDFYDDSGAKVRTIAYSAIEEFSGRKMPSRIVIRPVGKSSYETELDYLNAKFDQPLSSGTFTLERLRRGR